MRDEKIRNIIEEVSREAGVSITKKLTGVIPKKNLPPDDLDDYYTMRIISMISDTIRYND